MEKEETKVEDRAMDISRAAEYLGISRAWLYKLTSNRRITFYKPGGKKLYFLPEDLDEYLQQNRVQADFHSMEGLHSTTKTKERGSDI